MPPAVDITDEQIRKLRGVGDEPRARRSRSAAETRARRKFNDARDAAFKFFGSTDVEQAARANAIQRAANECAIAVACAVTKYRARCASILNAREASKDPK